MSLKERVYAQIKESGDISTLKLTAYFVFVESEKIEKVIEAIKSLRCSGYIIESKKGFLETIN